MVEHKSGGGNAANLGDYMLRQDENEEVPTVVEGDMRDLQRNDLRSQLHGHAHGNLHFIITSDRPITLQDVREKYMPNIEKAYGFKFKNHPYVIVEHCKPRADGKGYDRHFHVGAAYTSIFGKAANIHAAPKKNEFVGRATEHAMGHELVKGKHNHAVRKAAAALGMTDLVAAIDAAKICEGHRAEAQYGSKQKAIAQRVGFPLRDFSAALKAIPEGPDYYANVLKTAAKFGVDIAKSDRRNALVVRHGDKQVVANFNRLLGLKSADTKQLMRGLVAASEAAKAIKKSRHIKKETDDDRDDTSTRAAEGQAADVASLRVNQGGHQPNSAEAGRGIESRPEHAERNDGIAGSRGGRPQRSPRNEGRDAGLGAGRKSHSRRELILGDIAGAAVGDRVSGLSRTTGTGAARALNRIEQAQLNAAWALQNLPDPATKTKKADLRPMGQVPPIRPSVAPAGRRLSPLAQAQLSASWAAQTLPRELVKLDLPDLKPRREVAPVRPSLAPVSRRLNGIQQAQLQAGWAAKRDHLIGQKAPPALMQPDLRKRGQVPAVRPSLPSTDRLLSKLQASQLQSAWEKKRDQIIAASAFAKASATPDKSGRAAPIRPAAPLTAAHVTKLSTKQLREVFAEVRQLSGDAQQRALAALLQAHGLTLTTGAKSGVIAINKVLEDGSSEFVGSLERFAGIKTQDADRARLIEEITNKIRESRDVQKQDREQQRRDAGRDQAGHGEHKKGYGGSDEAGPGSRKSGGATGGTGRADGGEPERRGCDHRGPDDRQQRPVGGDRSVDERDRRGEARGDIPRQNGGKTAEGKGTLTSLIERKQASSALALRGDSISLYAERSRYSTPRSPAAVPRHNGTGRMPNATLSPARQSAIRRGLSASVGGPSKPFNSENMTPDYDKGPGQVLDPSVWGPSGP